MEIKKHILVFTLAMVFGMLSSCAKKTDWKEFGLYGKVKTYTENHYKVEKKSGEWQKGNPTEDENMKVYFNRDGNYELIEFMSAENSISEKSVPKRKGGKIVEELLYNANGDVLSRIEIKNQTDTKIESISFDKNGKKDSRGTTFLEDDMVVREEIEFISNDYGNTKIIAEYKYDENRNITSHKQISEEGEIMLYNRFRFIEFDDHNNWTKRLEYSYKASNIPQKMTIRVYEYY